MGADERAGCVIDRVPASHPDPMSTAELIAIEKPRAGRGSHRRPEDPSFTSMRIGAEKETLRKLTPPRRTPSLWMHLDSHASSRIQRTGDEHADPSIAKFVPYSQYSPFEFVRHCHNPKCEHHRAQGTQELGEGDHRPQAPGRSTDRLLPGSAREHACSKQVRHILPLSGDGGQARATQSSRCSSSFLMSFTLTGGCAAGHEPAVILTNRLTNRLEVRAA